MKAKDMILKARSGLILDQSFFATLLLKQKMEETPTTPRAQTNGKTIAYNPKWIEEKTLEEVKGILAHEILHTAFLHPYQFGNLDHETANDAMDYSINGILENAGFKLPPERLRQTRFDGKPWKEIYKILMGEKPTPKPGEGPNGKPGKDPGTGGTGSNPGGTGNTPQYSDPGKTGECNPYPDPDPTATKQAEQEAKIDLTQSAIYAKKHGTLPQELEKYLQELLNPVLPWKEILARFIDTASKNDYTWTRPNARYIQQGFYLPSLKAPELGKIVLAVDVSGSINPGEIKGMVSEVKGILNAYPGSELTVIFCNADIVGTPETLTQFDELKKIPRPGGGTSFKPPFDYIEEMQLDPKALVYFTDGECNSFPDPTPDYPVLWILTQTPGCYPWNPPTGETVFLDPQWREENP